MPEAIALPLIMGAGMVAQNIQQKSALKNNEGQQAAAVGNAKQAWGNAAKNFNTTPSNASPTILGGSAVAPSISGQAPSGNTTAPAAAARKPATAPSAPLGTAPGITMPGITRSPSGPPGPSNGAGMGPTAPSNVSLSYLMQNLSPQQRAQLAAGSSAAPALG